MNVVVVHRGARDSYQVALAMANAGKLERLITDVYWRPESKLAHTVEQVLGPRSGKLLGAHAASPLRSALVETCPLSGWSSLLLDKIPHAPSNLRSRATRWTDRTLGRTAGTLARESGSALLSYSYYGHSAFSAAGPETPRLLFQLHPHPSSMRQLLRKELAEHPECASSLKKEWELALSEDDFERLCAEPRMAQHWIAASSFTRRTLIEHGAPAASVHVAPYGVDLERFHPGTGSPRGDGPLRVLFVGTVNQRKGIKYLLEAVSQIGARHVQLVIRGRAVDGLELVRKMVPNADIRLSVSHEELLAAYRSSDLFVFPSIGEGFGHVLIESLASGLPVLSTTHTAAPDLVTECVDGFVIAPRRSDRIVERLEWALAHRDQLRAMRSAARRKAEMFTWERFRSRMVDIVDSALESRESETLVAEHV